jgi:hypothetical protein
MQGEQEKNWRLFEIGVDGVGLRQVTPDDGEDVAHFDPCYLPDGRIMFRLDRGLPGFAMRVWGASDDLPLSA